MILKQFPRGRKNTATKRRKFLRQSIFCLRIYTESCIMRVCREPVGYPQARGTQKHPERGFYDQRKVFFKKFIEAGGPDERQPVESSAFIRRAHHALVFSATDLRFNRRDNLRTDPDGGAGGGGERYQPSDVHFPAIRVRLHFRVQRYNGSTRGA